VIAYAGCAVLIVVALLAMAIIAGQCWNRFGLNHGGTDPKWMWFGGEPPGLQKERENSALAANLRLDSVGLFGGSAGGHTALSMAGGKW
jgi:hypothetical protein